MPARQGYTEARGLHKLTGRPELPPPQAPQKPAWEAGSDEGDSEEEETPEELQQASSEAFFDYLVELKTKGTLSAKQVGVLAHFAKGGGLYGKGASLAVSPSNQGGFFSTHFDKVTGLDQAMDMNMYQMHVPGYKRSELGRTEVVMEAMLPYEQIAEEVASVPNFEDQLDEVLDVCGWAPAYRNHPVIQANEAELVVPWHCTSTESPSRSATTSWAFG